MFGAAQVIDEVCELSSLLKLRRELTPTPRPPPETQQPLPKVLHNFYQASAAAAGKELAAPLRLESLFLYICVYTHMYVPVPEG